MQRFTGLLGLAVILAVAYLLSRDRKAIQLRIVAWGLGLQFAFAFLVLKTPFSRVFTTASNGINHLLSYASQGIQFVFGDKLGTENGGFGVIFGSARSLLRSTLFDTGLIVRRNATSAFASSSVIRL